ncbi:unnamed protein product [Malus baccata var. baccata]
MDRLSQAVRLIADIRLDADRLLETLFLAAQPHQSSKPLHLFLNEDASMRQHLIDLRSVERQLEESGVLNESLRSRSNSWGLHMPLICPDGAVASNDQCNEPASKKHRISQAPAAHNQEEVLDCKTLSEILVRFEKVHNLKVSTYERLDWLKRASSLPENESSSQTLKDHSYHSSSKLLSPSTFRAVVSLHTAGSIDPDAVAFFSPDEGGSFMHSRGFSIYHVYKHHGKSFNCLFMFIFEHAAIALQYFIGVRAETALHCLLHWICSYQTLFTKVCSKCGRLLAMDQKSALLTPPVYRPYRQFTTSNVSLSLNVSGAYHVGRFSEEL